MDSASDNEGEAGAISWNKQLEILTAKVADIKVVLKELIIENHKLIIENHKHQLRQLIAVQEAFMLNVQRDEELRETMLEAADPWVGC